MEVATRTVWQVCLGPEDETGRKQQIELGGKRGSPRTAFRAILNSAQDGGIKSGR